MDVGLHTTLSDANSIPNPEIISIAESINPLMAKEFGKVWDLFSVRSTPFQTDEYEILTRNYTAPEITVNATSADGWDSASDTTGLAVASATIDRVTVGDVLLVDDEIVVVKSVDRSGNTVDVYERGAGDTSGARHGTADKTAKIIGSAHEEGKVDPEALAEQTGKVTNYCQLFEELIDLTKEDDDQMRKNGVTRNTLRQEAMERVMRKLARTAIYGTARAKAAGQPALTRGFISYLNDIAGALKTAVGGAFTETVLKAGLDDVRKAGGTVNAIVMSVKNKRLFNAFTGADQAQFPVGSGVRTGGIVLDGYLADGFGVIPAVVDIDFPDDKVALINTRYMEKGWKVNDELRFVTEPASNSREVKESLQGKVGLSMSGIGRTHHLLTTIS